MLLFVSILIGKYQLSSNFITKSDPKVSKGSLICRASDLESAGKAFRFQVQCAEIQSFPGINADPEDYLAAFVVKFGDDYFAYLNRCAHIPMELDWNPGEVFDEDQRYIVCSTHYAVYEPKTGECLQGPCPKGAFLHQLPITIHNDVIYFGSLKI